MADVFEMKKCPKCNVMKNKEAFSNGWCKACNTIRYQSQEYRLKRRVRDLNRRAEEYGSREKLDTDEAVRAFKAFEDESICYYSNKETDNLTFEHVIPLSRGGRNHHGNIIAVDARFNSKKGDKPLLTFFEECDEFTVENLAAIVTYLSLIQGRDTFDVMLDLIRDVKAYEKTKGEAS